MFACFVICTAGCSILGEYSAHIFIVHFPFRGLQFLKIWCGFLFFTLGCCWVKVRLWAGLFKPLITTKELRADLHRGRVFGLAKSWLCFVFRSGDVLACTYLSIKLCLQSTRRSTISYCSCRLNYLRSSSSNRGEQLHSRYFCTTGLRILLLLLLLTCAFVATMYGW